MINTSTVVHHQTIHGVRGTLPAGIALSELLRDSGLDYTAEAGRIRIIPSAGLVRSAQREEQPDSSATTSSADSQVNPSGESTTHKHKKAEAGAENTPTNVPHLEVVIVSAQKRSEALQDVPEAISAITGEGLAAMGAESFTDYARTIPGLTFTDEGNGRQKPTIRGLNAVIGSDTVGYYIGETPIESTGASNYGNSVANPSLVDIDRIEVLRGPQGTLYGSSSLGGTIKLIPKAPNLSNFEGSISGTAQVTQGEGGSSPGGEGDLTLNVPIVDGVAAVRGVFWWRDLGGFINRTYGYAGNFGSPTPLPQGTVRNIPDEHTWGLRTIGLYQPTERLKVSAMIYLQRQHFDGFQDFTGGVTNPDNRLMQVLISNTPEPQDNQFNLYSLTASYDFGRFNLVSSTSYYSNDTEVGEEGTSATVLLPILFGISNTPARPFPNVADVESGLYDFTEETRLATSERIYGFDAVVGVFYSKNHQTGWFHWSPPQYNAVEANNDPANPLYAPGNDVFGDGGHGFERQTAEFGEITYHVTDALSATVGLRHYEVANGTNSFANGFFEGNTTAYLSTSALVVGTVHKGNLSYHVTPDDLIYAQYSEGFRPGFGNSPVPGNCNAPPSASQVQPDSIKNYEFGAKTQWLDQRLTVNAAVYRINWSGIQQFVLLPSCGFGYAANSGDAVNKGVELEVGGQLTRRLSAGLSGGYTQAHLQQNTPPNVCLATGSCAMAGDQIENVPNWQFAVYAQTTFPMLERDDGFARLDYQYTGHSFGEYIRKILPDGAPSGPIDPEYEVQAVRLLNLKTGMRRAAWEVSLAGNNLLNQVARQSIDPFAQITVLIAGRPRYVVNRPRTFSINAIYHF
jgi:outer membrane receptor protein involved in Fe transport